MGLMDVVGEAWTTLSVTDVPGGRSIFGPFEPLFALFSPFFGDKPPTAEEVGDAVLDSGGAAAPLGSGGLTGPALKEGKKNVRDYNRRKREVLDDVLSPETRGEVQSKD